MMKIKIIAVGKVKEKYFTDACNEYLKRLTRYASVTITEVKEENFVTEPSSLEIEQILKKEYETLHLSPRARSRIIKVARTIADMAESERISPSHLLEAISYRH